MKKEVIYISIAAITAVCGFALGFMVGRKKNEKVTETNDEIVTDSEEMDGDSYKEVAYETELYSDKIHDLEYRSTSDDPDDALTEEEEAELINHQDDEAVKDYKKENYGKIEPLTRSEWEKHLYQEALDVDYSADDLYYFPDGDYITDDRGGILTPTEKYVGDVLDRFRFRTNDDDELYLRNHPMETDFAIHKIRQSRDEYFS